MASTVLPHPAVSLHGAPDSDIGSKDTKLRPCMQLELTQDVVDELLDSMRSGNKPQLLFGRVPQLKYADKTHAIHTSTENYRYELYETSGAGSDEDFEFAGLISHSLAVQKAENVTAGVDSALEQLKSNMAAVHEAREANKTIVGDATPLRTPTPGHRRFPSKSFNKPHHLAPSSLGSPLPSAPSSPMPKGPTSQPAGNHEALLRALRVPLIHLLAVQPARDTFLAETCRTSPANVRDLLPKIAKPSPADADKWQLTDKSFRDLDPWKFPYKSQEDRERAIENAIKSFDRLRHTKDDKIWQKLLPVEERGQGKCLSRLNVKAPEQKPSTPLHKMPKLNEKKPAVTKKAEDKEAGRDAKKPREKADAKVVKKPVKPKEKASVPAMKEPNSKTTRPTKQQKPNATPNSTSTPPSSTSTTTSTSKAATTNPKSTTLPKRNTPSIDEMAPNKIRTIKMKVPSSAAAAQVKAKPPPQKEPQRDSQREHAQKARIARPSKPVMPMNTKPKNPSPLSVSPPVNASDFDMDHPVHKALSAAASPAKSSQSPGNSDRNLKRKANDLDNGIHNHSVSLKQPRMDRPTPTTTPSSSNSRTTGNTPSSANSLKRKSDDSSTSNTPTNKARKVTNIDTGLASRYPTHNNHTSPGESSSSATSPANRLSFRQTVELSQKFQQYYKKYEALYWQLAESSTPPTEEQRTDLMKMHKKLDEMKQMIKSGADTR